MSISASNRRGASGRYDWVDVAKGICIVAVVCLYTRQTFDRTLHEAGWLQPWTVFAKPFRMPDFFLLSGLFLGAVMHRSWRSFLDTKVVHYLYFLALWVGIIYLYDAFHAPGLRDLDQTPYQAVRRYVYYLYSPDHMLWFIQTLPAFFVVTRLLRRVPPLLMLAAAAALMLLDPNTPVVAVNNFCQYYVFFLAGYLGAPRIFQMADWVGGHKALGWGLLAAWVVGNQWAVTHGLGDSRLGSMLLGFVGISAIISLSRLLSDWRGMGWLRYLGSNSIVVYLGFYIPLNVLTSLYLWSGWQVSIHLVAITIVVLSVLMPVLLFQLTRGTSARYLFERPRWARLTSPRGEVSSMTKPQLQ